ncbi:FecR family protein [Chitinophaga costaii]|uniref:FecR family protein n=1 Tax=Chitinophaga costaii TaxID=1335309 RepID=A0A1C4DG47_9BACT|nr:FecR domain-containing protein [Chitinophaga costaii]SCC30342.1 FecR family protein [Chitinophaga costaii]
MDFSQYSIEDFVCDESFQSYCTGANPAQVLFWEAFAAEHPARQADMDTAKQLVQILTAHQGNRLEQLQQLRQGMAQSARLQTLLAARLPDQASALPARRRYRAVTAVAAAIIVLVVSVATFKYVTTQPSQPIAHFSVLTFAAGSAPRKTVVLPDGSVITLRSQSKAVLDTGFNQSNRTLTLEGEAFFDVKQDAAHPFIVHTQQAAITVLGTQFNVRAWPGKGATETALFRGQVSVLANGATTPPVLLAPHEKLVVENIPASPAKRAANQPMKVLPLNGRTAQENAWVHSRLEIENEPLKAIAAKLEKWYGIPIVFEGDEVQQYRYSGTFDSESIVEALKALQLSYAFSFKMEHGKIIIRK